MVDTIVMANLGYFQLKASPGLWNLQLAPGRSSELYYMAGLGDASQDAPLNQTVVVDDLSGKLVRLAVVKRPGKETEKLLLSAEEDEDEDEDEDDEVGGVNSLTTLNFFVGSDTASRRHVALLTVKQVLAMLGRHRGFVLLVACPACCMFKTSRI